MKRIIIVSLLIICSIQTYGQTDSEVNLIVADSTWGKEILKVPFWFAPEIDYKGYEDIRFAKGWEDIESAGFWTLVFAWDINLETTPTTQFFENNLMFYFDGLMKVVNEDTTVTIRKTKASFIVNKTENGTTSFTGIIETYDAFTTQRIITLHVVIESYYCSITKRHIPLFKISPKNFEHKVWEQLNQIELQDTICDRYNTEQGQKKD